MRAVLDPNVLISALLTPHGEPAQIVRSWLAGAYELFVSESLLAELRRALRYPKLRALIEPTEAQELLDLLRREAEVIDDPDDPPAIQSPDPDPDYLIALAMSARAVLVSGDGHLLGLGPHLPIYAPAEFLALLAQEPGA